MQVRPLHTNFQFPITPNIHFPEVFKNSEATATEGGDKLYVVISSDKGLCGGIHSSVSKATRRAINEDTATPKENVHVMVIGDKSKAQLSRAIPTHLDLAFNGVGKDVPTFADASAITDLILSSGVKFDSVRANDLHYRSDVTSQPAHLRRSNLLLGSPRV